MKRTVIFLIAIMISASVEAQPVVKGHAWKEQSARGAKPSVVAGESGNVPARTARGSGNLFIFLEYKNGQNILPYRLWIDGKPYRVANEMKRGGSVIRQTASAGSGFDNDTLVAPTNHQVLQVSAVAPLSQLKLPPLQSASTDAANGKIVVEYYWRAKRYAYTIPEIKMLRPVRLQ